ncbi:MAG: hypothetical protein AB1403_18285, partial [Candidatus Riflebacteria bacterium]
MFSRISKIFSVVCFLVVSIVFYTSPLAAIDIASSTSSNIATLSINLDGQNSVFSIPATGTVISDNQPHNFPFSVSMETNALNSSPQGLNIDGDWTYGNSTGLVTFEQAADGTVISARASVPGVGPWVGSNFRWTAPNRLVFTYNYLHISGSYGSGTHYWEFLSDSEANAVAYNSAGVFVGSGTARKSISVTSLKADPKNIWVTVGDPTSKVTFTATTSKATTVTFKVQAFDGQVYNPGSIATVVVGGVH